MIDSKPTLVALILCVLIGIICIIIEIFSNNNIETYEYGNTYIVHQKDVNTGNDIYKFCILSKEKDCTDISKIDFEVFKDKILNMQKQKNKIELDNKILRSDIKGSI